MADPDRDGNGGKMGGRRSYAWQEMIRWLITTVNRLALTCVVPRIVRLVTAVLTTAVGAWALQTTPVQQDSSATVLTPVFLTGQPSTRVALPNQNHWQVGGVATRFSSVAGKGTLDFSGGLAASRSLTSPRQQVLGSDRQTFQRIEYRLNGLRIAGAYAEVGSQFQGLDTLTKGMNPAEAKLLVRGMRQSAYEASYTGIRGLELSSSRTSLDNAQEGHQEKGISRTALTHRLAWSLAPGQKVEYLDGEQTEEWDPLIAKRGSLTVHTRSLRLSGAVGQRSQYVLGQTLTDTNRAGQLTDTRQRDLTVKWNEWRALSLNGGYTDKNSPRSGDRQTTYNLELSATPNPNTKITGKYANNTTRRVTGVPRRNETLNLGVATQLATNLQLTSQIQDNDDSDSGEQHRSDHLLRWQIAPTWRLTTRLLASSTTAGQSTGQQDYTLNGDIGSKRHPGQFSLFNRNETLANHTQQGRSEITYTHGFAGSPVKVVVQTGEYRLRGSTAQCDERLGMVQVRNLPLVRRTTASLGYYDGPVLGAGYLKTYRSWGLWNTGNLGAWGAKDFARYHEFSGEVAHQLTPSTRLVVKQMAGILEGAGPQETLEYSLDQRWGKAQLQAGWTQTLAPGQHDPIIQHASHWQLTTPALRQVPAWALNTVRDGLPTSNKDTWRLRQAPQWTRKPADSGITVVRNRGIIAGKAVEQSCYRLALMLTPTLFTQASYERNPANPDRPDDIVQAHRSLLHLAYASGQHTQVFARYTMENRTDANPDAMIMTTGIQHEYSPSIRLQALAIFETRTTRTETLDGMTYALNFQRDLGADNRLVANLCAKPAAFYASTDRLYVEASYHHAF